MVACGLAEPVLFDQRETLRERIERRVAGVRGQDLVDDLLEGVVHELELLEIVRAQALVVCGRGGEPSFELADLGVDVGRVGLRRGELQLAEPQRDLGGRPSSRARPRPRARARRALEE
jgi:hypothetical protein